MMRQRWLRPMEFQPDIDVKPDCNELNEKFGVVLMIDNPMEQTVSVAASDPQAPPRSRPVTSIGGIFWTLSRGSVPEAA